MKTALNIKDLGELEDFTDLLFSHVYRGLRKTNIKGLWNWGYYDVDNVWHFSFKSDDIGKIVMRVIEFYRGFFLPNERALLHDTRKRFFVVNTIIMKIAKNLYIKENE